MPKEFAKVLKKLIKAGTVHDLRINNSHPKQASVRVEQIKSCIDIKPNSSHRVVSRHLNIPKSSVYRTLKMIWVINHVNLGK